MENLAEAGASEVSVVPARLVAGYFLLALFLVGAVSASLVLGSRRTPAPAFAGSYASRSLASEAVKTS